MKIWGNKLVNGSVGGWTGELDIPTLDIPTVDISEGRVQSRRHEQTIKGR